MSQGSTDTAVQSQTQSQTQTQLVPSFCHVEIFFENYYPKQVVEGFYIKKLSLEFLLFLGINCTMKTWNSVCFLKKNLKFLKKFKFYYFNI